MNQLSSWLPDLALSRIWAISVILLSIFWFFIQLSLEPSNKHLSIHYVSWLSLFSILFGIAYGSFASSIFLVSRYIAKKFNNSLSLSLPTQRIVKVTILMYVVHALSIGVLSLFRAWQEPWPWFLGVVPQLWQ